MKHTEWLNFILIYMTKNNDKIFQAIKNVNQKVMKTIYSLSTSSNCQAFPWLRLNRMFSSTVYLVDFCIYAQPNQAVTPPLTAWSALRRGKNCSKQRQWVTQGRRVSVEWEIILQYGATIVYMAVEKKDQDLPENISHLDCSRLDHSLICVTKLSPWWYFH